MIFRLGEARFFTALAIICQNYVYLRSDASSADGAATHAGETLGGRRTGANYVQIMNLRTLCFALCAASTLAVAGCRKPYAAVDGEMLGTFVQINARTSLPPTEIYERAKRIDAEMKRSMSIFDEGSLLSRINRGETDIADNHIKFNLELAGRVNAVSGGAYDVTVKPLVEAYGFAGKDRSRRVNVDSIMRFVGFDKVRVEGDRLIKADPRVQLDFNSIAKGYTVDLVARMLEEEGMKDYLVDIGGEVRCRGRNPKGGAWRVGVETPFEGNDIPGSHVQQIISLTDCALATSGNYRRCYTDDEGRKVAHTIDPLTGLSAVTDLLSATVVAPTCAEADAYGTMFMALGKERAIESARRLESDGIMVYFIAAAPDGGYEVYYSKALGAALKRIGDFFHAI